ncbi:MAG: hypothetical protein JHC26_10470 [Thermofilum sp.]|jgi:CII-binding regulator of phage lambda lysogenization HflD|uniref:hypothetical protein n=1 Tax=Thermofilum sp. TaxID=1961369 RepID=UPI002583D0F3|nr:hypothetical protein [Thermofilum sp.]MCI4409504.1 hypothetical protein [Thermofilum sp.]
MIGPTVKRDGPKPETYYNPPSESISPPPPPPPPPPPKPSMSRPPDVILAESASPPPPPPPPPNNQQKKLPGFNLPKPEWGYDTQWLEQANIPPIPPPSSSQQSNNSQTPQQNSQKQTIVANASTPQSSQSSQPSNPLSAIGSFFSGIVSGASNAIQEAKETIGGALSNAKDAVTGALSSAGNTITGALSTADNWIQSNYASVFGDQTQQDKQQLQSALDQINQNKQQLQQELSNIEIEKIQTQVALKKAFEYKDQVLQMLQQDPNDPQLQSYLQQIQQNIQQLTQNLAQLEQEEQQIQQELGKTYLETQEVQQNLAQLNQQESSNPVQRFFVDFAKGSALLGYYVAEGAGGVGWELANLVKGKGLEDFGQAVSEFNATGGQNIAKGVGYATEIALPAVVTAVVAPELLPAVVIGEGASVGIGEVASKITTGQWQSLQDVAQEANTGGMLGLIGGAAGTALGGALAKLGTKIGGRVGDFLAGTGGRALAGASVNLALTAPFTNDPKQLLLAGALGALGGAAGELVSKVPWLEQSEAVKTAIDTSKSGAKLGNKLVNEGIKKGVLTPDEISGKTTTQLGELLRQKYSILSHKLISLLDKDTKESLKEKGIITDTQVLKPDKFIKSVKDLVPENQLQLFKDTAELVEKYNEGIKKLVGGWKFRIGDRTLIYRLKLGDIRESGFGSAGKSRIFNDIRTVNDMDANVAGIYNNPSDVRDTIVGLKSIPKEASFLEKLYEATRVIRSPLSKLKPDDEIELSLRTLEDDKDIGTAKAQMLAQTIKDYFKDEVGKRKVVIYGSNSVKQYLEDIAKRLGGTLDTTSDPEYYLIKRGGEVLWKWRRPGDVDAFIYTDNPNDLEKIAQDLADRMNKVLGANRFKAVGHLVIDKKTGEHVIDLHMPNEPSDNFNLYAVDSTGADLGLQRPTPNYTDLGVAKVSQIALDKGNAIGAMRDETLNSLIKEINEGTHIDNLDHVVYLVKQILKDKDPGTVRDTLIYFLDNIRNDRVWRALVQRFSREFNIPESELALGIPRRSLEELEGVFNKTYRYFAPASYRFKDAQDFLTLLKLASELKNDDKLRALYEQLRAEFEERGLIPKGWQPNELSWSTIQNAQKLSNSISSARSVGSVTSFTSPVVSLGGSNSGGSGRGGSNSITSSTTSVTSTTSSGNSGSGRGGSSGGGEKYTSSIILLGGSGDGGGGSDTGGKESIDSVSLQSPSNLPSIYIYYDYYDSSTSPSTSTTSPNYYIYYDYIESESVSPSPVFSPFSIIPSGYSPLMGPPPIVPSVAPGGGPGGGVYSSQETSGTAAEVIHL